MKQKFMKLNKFLKLSLSKVKNKTKKYFILMEKRLSLTNFEKGRISQLKDQNLSITHFYNEVLIECVVCSKMAKCSVSNETNVAKLICLNCGLN